MTEAADDAKRLIGAFTEALQRGEDPDIESSLKRLPDRRQRAQLLVALIDVEARFHIARGNDVSLETYLARFPALADEKLAPARQFITQKTEQYKRELKASRVGASPAGADLTVSSDGHLPPTHTQDAAVTQTQASRTPTPGLANISTAEPRYIGKYLVIAELDRGGQATVFRAAHPQLGTEVAIKMFHSRHPQSVERLHNEGRTLASLRHPGIASVYDLDLHDGQPFVVMEYVRGRNLAQYAADETVPPEKACAIIAKVARALAVAHRAGVLHLDIKPHNILIDADGEPRLIDFGLARFRQSLGEEKEHPSRLIGTLLYMSPEQANAQSDQLTARSDIFSLGCVLFELLTGQRPYVGATKAEVLERAKHGQIGWKPLDDATAPEAMKAVCRRAMAPSPAERFNSAAEMADQLEAAGAAPARRSNTPLLIGAGVAAAVLVAIAVGVIIGTLNTEPPVNQSGSTPPAPGNTAVVPTSLDGSSAPPQPPQLPPHMAPASGEVVPLSPLRMLVDRGQLRDPGPHEPIKVSDRVGFELRVVPPNHDCWILARDPSGESRVLARHEVNSQVAALKLPDHEPTVRIDLMGTWLFVAVTAPKGALQESRLLDMLSNAGALPSMSAGEVLRISDGAAVRGPEGGEPFVESPERKRVEMTATLFAKTVRDAAAGAGISAVALTPTTVDVHRPQDNRPQTEGGVRESPRVGDDRPAPSTGDNRPTPRPGDRPLRGNSPRPLQN